MADDIVCIMMLYIATLIVVSTVYVFYIYY